MGVVVVVVVGSGRSRKRKFCGRSLGTTAHNNTLSNQSPCNSITDDIFEIPEITQRYQYISPGSTRLLQGFATENNKQKVILELNTKSINQCGRRLECVRVLRGRPTRLDWV